MERKSHKKPFHSDFDITKPLPIKQLMETVSQEDCYTQLWEPQNKMCQMCASLDMCGILYNARLTKKVKEIEAEAGGYLDSNYFDCIEPSELKQWLAMKERTFDAFVAKIAKFSNCPDHETCVFWCKSFIKETAGISLKSGIVIVK